jgi:histidyl-tRNA synthetase
MNLKPTKPLSGFIELLPAQQRCFDECAARMQSVLRAAGFSHLDLPAVERAEVLTDKDNWDEIETQMFLFQKGDTKMGLRYDGTVGLARYVAGKMNNLTFPFRAYQFARNYRGERPQRGRYREFYQMDLDIMGQGVLSENYDAEIVAVLANAYKSIEKFIGGATVRIGNRKFWNAMFEHLNLDSVQSRNTFILIDKKDKLNDFTGALSETVGDKNASEINRVFIDGYKSFLNKSIKLDSSIAEMDDFMIQLSAMGVKNAEIDLGIMRGHAYYTGIVFEFFLEKFPELDAVGGGGRYEDLASKFSKAKIIGVGAAVGFSRLMVALLDENKIDLSGFENPIDVAVLVMGDAQVSYAMGITASLRAENIVAVPYLDTEKKFRNQIEFADKIKSRFSMIIGENEAKNQVLAVKDMISGDQRNLSLPDAIKLLKNIK